MSLEIVVTSNHISFNMLIVTSYFISMIWKKELYEVSGIRYEGARRNCQTRK